MSLPRQTPEDVRGCRGIFYGSLLGLIVFVVAIALVVWR